MQLRRQEFRQKLEARARMRRENHGMSSLYSSNAGTLRAEELRPLERRLPDRECLRTAGTPTGDRGGRADRPLDGKRFSSASHSPESERRRRCDSSFRHRARRGRRGRGCVGGSGGQDDEGGDLGGGPRGAGRGGEDQQTDFGGPLVLQGCNQETSCVRDGKYTPRSTFWLHFSGMWVRKGIHPTNNCEDNELCYFG
nr:uncharacterized protein LOC113821757 [Penaeus vannamei]